MPTKKPHRHFISRTTLIGMAVAVAAILITFGISTVLYNHTVNLLTDNLRQRLISIVTTAVVHIDAEEVDALIVEEDYKKPEWESVVTTLKKTLDNNEDLLFVYVYRKTDSNEFGMEFVADANSLDPYANTDDDPTNNVDVDNNGIIDDVDWLQWPGQEYEAPEDAFAAYGGPMTNSELYEDQYGKVITGYAPIKRADGSVAAILAADIKADDFSVLTTQTLTPFIAFIVGLVGIILLLTGILIRFANRQIALMAELDNQKNELLSIVSHQLATPISSVRWYLEMMLDGDIGDLSKAQKEHVTKLQTVVDDLTSLVHMILEVSRVQLGKMRVDRTNVDLDDLVSDVLDGMEPLAEEKDIKLIKTISAPLGFAYMDRRLLHLVTTNLLSNAIKYTPKQGEVELMVTNKDGNFHVDVRDTGIGIPKVDQKRVFEKLHRATNVGATNGNGLGLYATKGSTEALGGTINFVSTEGEGTTFTVNIPSDIEPEKEGEE